jgi:uncharacterized protein YtpQ (UPF0354 family)
MFTRALALVLCLIATPCCARVAEPSELSDTLHILAEALTTAMPGFKIIVDDTDLSILIKKSDGVELRVNPDNLHLSLRAAATDDERQSILDDYVRVFTAAGVTRSAVDPIDTAKILPVIRGGFVLDQVGPDFMPYRAFEEGLIVYWVVDSDTSTQSVSFEDVAALGLSQAEIESIASENIALKANDLEGIEAGEFVMLKLDGYYESSLLLVPELWQELDASMGRVVVAPIARDLVLLGDADVPGQTENLAAIAAEEWPKAAYPITTELLVWETDHWSILRN